MSLWDNWGDERGCDEGHWHAHTRGLPWSLPEIVGTVQVYCSRRRLRQRGQEFHVCTINKSAHTKKSLETYLMILVYTYIYKMYITQSVHLIEIAKLTPTFSPNLSNRQSVMFIIAWCLKLPSSLGLILLKILIEYFMHIWRFK